jgi:hypothetical protein
MIMNNELNRIQMETVVRGTLSFTYVVNIVYLNRYLEIYRVAQKSINKLVKCALKSVRNFFFSYLTKIQCTSYNNVIFFYKFTGMLKSELSL